MAEIKIASGLVVDTHAKILDRDPRDSTKPVADEMAKNKDDLSDLTAWVMGRVNRWREHRKQNYDKDWDVYERLWRGMWAGEDRHRKSERSTLVTPGLAEAVENIVAEVEEAVFGRGDFFDIKADAADSEMVRKITEENKNNLKEDLGRSEFVPNIGEALINAAVYGTGLGEIVLDTFTLREIQASIMDAYPQPVDKMAMPMASPMMSGAAPMGQGMPAGPTSAMSDAGMMQMGEAGGETMGAEATGGEIPMEDQGSMQGMPGMMPEPMGAAAPMAPPEMKVTEREVTYACLQSVNPRNFVIDPTARTIDKALGCGVEEYVGAHIIHSAQKKGDYRQVDVTTGAGEQELLPDRQRENEYVFDKVLVLRYYGLVPKSLLFPPKDTVDLTAQPDEGTPAEKIDEGFTEIGEPEAEKSIEPIDAEMVESIVVIANGAVCLKAAETPYVMKDRPVIAFPWDIVPGRFWGRGVCEKGLVPQKVMDAEMRARIDALAYVSAPMMAMDASRLPRGFQLTVKPGKSILTNGDPKTILNPLHFGQLDQSTFNHSQQLDQMIQRATGSLDVIALAQKSGEARPGAVSMMLSGIVKRHKRTLMNFIERFFVPALRKIMWRNMQFYSERYRPVNWTFVASSVMGILQREYETQTLVQLLQSVDPQSKEYKIILMGVIANTGLKNRTELVEMIQASISTAQQMEAAQAQQASDPALQQQQNQLTGLQVQLQIGEIQAKIAELASRTRLQDAKAQNQALEPQFRQMEFATKGIYDIQGNQQDRAIKNRLALADRALKLRDIASNERIATVQSSASLASERVKAQAQVAAAAQNANAAQAKDTTTTVHSHWPTLTPNPLAFPHPFIARRAVVVG